MHTYTEPPPYLPSATNGVFTTALLAQLDVTTPTHVDTLFIRVTRAVEDATDKKTCAPQLARTRVSDLSPSPELLKRSVRRARRALIQHCARLLVV